MSGSWQSNAILQGLTQMLYGHENPQKGVAMFEKCELHSASGCRRAPKPEVANREDHGVADMSSMDDYIKRHTLARRQDYDQYISHLLDVYQERGRSFGILVNPLTAHVKYKVVKHDENGQLVTLEYALFQQAYEAYVEGAEPAPSGLRLV